MKELTKTLMSGRRNKVLYRGVQGKVREGGRWRRRRGKGKGRKPISIELCYVPGTVPGTLHTLSHLTLRTALKYVLLLSHCILQIKRLMVMEV